ncbi:MAG TPA: hypothetical protein DCR43_03880 [Bacteroidales bacterium]|nr:MAG: hypothetical protein A2X11_00575 [Bacteroidetes bacterium GWE2_42_24]OFY27537.1 MAG: hypothetical protein A2X09_07650 [Bacteroidetes bacterium GWF2_43_11]HAQ64982.1 hypothetical protein [Bacteroidales bacterium]HBZ66061.1 hypothetical protein [Bacteroidales bacterium]
MLFLATKAFSQDSPGFKEYDQTTWRLYQQRQWDSLIIVGKQAMASGNDYQYLNARLGVAWFEKGNYRMASRYFGKALRLNQGDEFSREYLYFSMLYSGRSGGARSVTNGFSEAARQRLQLKSPVMPAYVYVELGPLNTNAINSLRDSYISGSDSIYGELNLPGNAFYFHAGGGFELGSFVTAYAAYSNLSLDRYERIELGDIDTIRRSYDFNQHEAYLNLSVEPVPGLRIVPSFHFIYNRSRPIIATYNQDSAAYNFHVKSYTNKDIATGIALYADFGLFDIALHGNYATLMNKTQTGGGAAITWFPSGNLDYWLKIHTSMLSEDGQHRWVTEPSAGVRIFPHVWAEASAAFGDLTRYVDETNFLLLNTDDKTTLRAQGVIYIPAFENVMFSFRYIYNRAEGLTWHYDLAGKTMLSETFDYQRHTLLGGIKWSF